MSEIPSIGRSSIPITWSGDEQPMPQEDLDELRSQCRMWVQKVCLFYKIYKYWPWEFDDPLDAPASAETEERLT